MKRKPQSLEDIEGKEGSFDEGRVIQKKYLAKHGKRPWWTKEGVELNELDKLRTLYWFRRVISIAGCLPKEIGERFFIDVAEPEKSFLYAEGRRQPSISTLSAFERAYTGEEPDKRPFAGTKGLFLNGPEGADLWKVLSGDLKSCRAVFDGFYEEEYGRGGLVNSTFTDRMSYMLESLFHSHQIEETKDLLTSFRIDDFAHPLDLHAALTMEAELLDHPLLNNFLKGQKYPMGDLVAALAMRTVAYAERSFLKEADYVWLGVGRILLEKLPEIHDELLAILQHDIEEKNKNIFSIGG
ncbi:hypothetical protein K6L09_20570 [Burkholderia cepacia]